MTADELEPGKTFGRYLDVDGDGIPYRTYPGTHPTRGSYFTRGTTKDRYARYTEEGPAYVDNMQRLLRKFETAKTIVPAPVVDEGGQAHPRRRRSGSARPAPRWRRRSRRSRAQGIHLDPLRIRAFPFADAVAEFIAAHEHVFVVEQNRDAQLRMLLVNECGIDPAKLISVLHYDGTPITARFITQEIGEKAADVQRDAAAQGRALGRRRLNRSPHDLSRQTEAASSRAAEERARATRIATTKARCRRCAPAAATTRSRPRSSRRSSSSTIAPHRVAKLSGIGCSSKTPTYFLGNSHGFNSVHGRMPSVLTGANARQPRPDLSGRVRRRRLGVDRARPVRARDAPRREHGLHRREQRRLRSHQGAVLGDRGQGLEGKRGAVNTRRADRPRHAGAGARRELRRARASPATRRSSCRWSRPPCAQGAAFIDVDQPVRRVQQPSRARPRATTTCASTTRRSKRSTSWCRAIRSPPSTTGGSLEEVVAARRRDGPPAQGPRDYDPTQPAGGDRIT